ncbi:hypothetical protein ACQPXM_29610 [Kribbella sp. CA-253562]|uniref:hypothetical protein n=1 Tax=Kribbella sp. CA-253562 TaxID=3239942 RepID=UPI003D8A031B
MRTSTPLAAAVLAVGLTACGGGSETSAGPAATDGSPPPVQDSIPTQTTAAALPTGPHAKDGFNYPACKDARCEIYVRTGTKVPLKQSVAGFGTLLVSKATASGVDFTGKNPDTTGSVGQQPGYRARIGTLDVVTVTVNQRHPAGNGVETLAILRLSPA